MMSEFKLSFDPRREDHRTIQADHIGGLYSKLHALKPDAVLFTGFPKLQTAASSMPDPIPVMAKEYVARGEGDKFLDALHKGFTKVNISVNIIMLYMYNKFTKRNGLHENFFRIFMHSCIVSI